MMPLRRLMDLRCLAALFATLALVGFAPQSSAQNADITTTIVDSPDPVANGANVTYTVTVQNNGPSTAENITAQFTCTNGTFVSTTLEDGTYTVSNGNSVQVTFGSAPATGAFTFDLVFQAQQPAAPQPQQVSLSGTASSTTNDPNPNNNSFTATTNFDGSGPGNGEILYGVTTQRELITFGGSNPSNILSSTPISGLTDQDNGESVRAIDFRPATEELYGVGNAPGGIYRLYKIDLLSGVATQIGGNLQGVPGSLGMNFQPTTDEIRIVGDNEANFRHNPDNAALISNDGNLAYANGDSGFGMNPNVVTLSYTNSTGGAGSTTLYVIDTARDVLAIQDPNSGTLTTVGALGVDVPSFTNSASLAISPATGTAHLALNNPGTQKTFLYTVNLGTGAATLVGEVGTNLVVRSISSRVSPPPTPTPPPTTTPTPKPEPRVWAAGRDLAENERDSGDSDANPTNTLYPVWSYGYRDRVDGTDFTPFAAADHTNERGDYQGWTSNFGIVVVNASSDSAQFFAGNVPFKPFVRDQILLKRTSTAYMPVVRWTAPSAGNYRITAKWLDLNPIDNGGAAHVLVNGQQVFGRQQNGAFVGQEWNDEGPPVMMPTRNFELQAGAVVDFVLSTRASDSNTDDTAFSAVIANAPSVAALAPSEVSAGEDVPVGVLVAHKYPIASVKLRVNLEDAPLPADTSAPYEFALKGLAPGTYKITAVAYDDHGVESPSEQIEVVVTGNAATARAARAAAKAGGMTTPVAAMAGRTFRCTQSGRWDDAATWGGEGVPGRNDHAIIPADRQVELFGGNFEVNNLDISGVLFVSPTAPFNPRLSIYGTMLAERALLGPETGDSGSGLPAFIIESTGKLVITNGTTHIAGGYLFNHGSTVVGENGSLSAASGVAVESNGDLRVTRIPGSNQPTVARMGQLDLKGGRLVIEPFAQVLLADRIVAAGGGNIVAAGGGNLVGADGASLVGPDGASLVGPDGASLVGPDGASLVGPDGASLVGPDGASLLGANGGSLVGPDGASIEKRSAPNSERTTKEASDDFRGILLQGGTVSGNLTMRGNVLNEAAFISPGNSAGRIRIDGNYTQEANGTLLLELGGAQLNQFDRLQVFGTANLGGNLIVKTIDGFTPQDGQNFSPLTYGAVNGQFASVSSNAQISFGPSGASMQVSGPNPPAPKALNIATRMRVETGDNVLIAGFIITGSQPKRVLVRGIGPSLPVEGALGDPTLDLDAGTFFNDDWRSEQQGEIEGTTIPPSSDLESAIVATLDPGAHTAVLRGKNDGTGVGLVEVYDLESGSPVQLANISTRGQVQTGDNVMIGGFIIGGDYPAKVLIRAIGPSLPVDGALQDPTLELVDSNGASISNDNWRTTQEAEIAATTIPPVNEKEAAIVATLVPGAYTAVVRGKDDTTGVALVEGYTLQ